jgi:hypothetical protein
MKLDHYIADLLFQYDCVIVPGLGGFVTNYKSASIQPIQNSFYPPSKGISFNKNLRNNDGLLANFIAQKENISYDVSYKKIEDFVLIINKELRLKKTILLAEIGALFLDAENRIQFEPSTTVNYLLESYGLPIFQKPPIKRTTIEDKIKKEFKDRTAPLAAKETTGKTKKWMVAAAITIPLIFFAIWIPTQYDVTGNLNYANLNPFTPSSKSIYTPNKSIIDINPTEESNIKDKIALADVNAQYIQVSFDKNEATFVVKLRDNPVAEVVNTYVSTKDEYLHYHIIGGCFSKKSNAKRLVKKLKQDGFDASILGKRKGLWTVSYNSFATRKEALTLFANAKAHNSKAWILNQSF